MSLAAKHTAKPGIGGSLWTRGFLAINLVAFLVYCNMALFFLLFHELQGLGMNSKQAGLIIAAFSVSVLLIRPLISPLLHPGNCSRWLALGAVGTAISLSAYPLFTSLAGFLVLRVLHGCAYVLMASATLAAFTGCVPQGRSGEAFGVLGVVTLLPYAVVPPLVGGMAINTGDYFSLVAWSAPAMILVLPLLYLLRPQGDPGTSREYSQPGWKEIGASLRDPAMLGILGLYLLLTASFAIQFYFVAPYAKKLGFAYAGWFFTLSTGSEIGVRLAASRFLDRLGKNRTLAAASLWVALCFAGLAACSSSGLFLGLALAIGLGWGVALPLFGALVFDLSPPRLRPMTANLAMEAFQGGLLLGPLLGGFTLRIAGYEGLFGICALLGLLVAAGSLLLPLRTAGQP